MTREEGVDTGLRQYDRGGGIAGIME